MTKTNVRSKSKNESSTLRSIFKIIGYVLAGIFLLVCVFIYYLQIKHGVVQNSQANKFNQARQKCGKDPVVVVREEAYLLGGNVDYYLYTPLHPDYQANRQTVDSDSFGNKKVVGYYCTVDEAKSQNPEAQDNDLNYNRQ